LGDLRNQIRAEDDVHRHLHVDEIEDDEEDSEQSANFNQLLDLKDVEAARQRRMRWLSQVCEYWPLKRLASITDDDIFDLLSSYKIQETRMSGPATVNESRSKRRGNIILAGSGPGSPSLLTTATLNAIQNADVVLADKLVPSAVLDLIPRRTAVHIARKFPGNADTAQDELLELGLQGLSAGKTVLRLKQGDPFLFGRGGEEVLWFRDRGFEPVVLPGITSALSAPLFAGIAVTQRDTSDEVLICTGTSKKGKSPQPPEFKQNRTAVFLMALHRLSTLVDSLTVGPLNSDASTEKTVEDDTTASTSIGNASKQLWPVTTPCTIVERASCRDQRVIRSSLQYICIAVEELGSRPPGLLIVGRACETLQRLGEHEKWKVEEGLPGFEWLGDTAEGAGMGYADERRGRVVAHVT
jgi:uroporphyrin-III C-methyltransferase